MSLYRPWQISGGAVCMGVGYLQVVMTPVWVLYHVLTAGGPALAESFDSFFMLSSLGHNHPMAFAAANTAAVACVMAAVGHLTVKEKLTT